jgi:uncharacterized membrane protein YvbJ
MVYCSNCGELCADNFKFCPKCGTKLKSVSDESENSPETSSEENYSIEENEWHTEY